MQSDLPKFNFCDVFENAEIIKKNCSICFSFTEFSENKGVFQKVKIRSSCLHKEY